VSSRELNTAVYLLRCIQLGLHLSDLEELDYGAVTDLMIESGNDDYDYPMKASKEDIARL
jgi:hypothetical protein